MDPDQSARPMGSCNNLNHRKLILRWVQLPIFLSPRQLAILVAEVEARLTPDRRKLRRRSPGSLG